MCYRFCFYTPTLRYQLMQRERVKAESITYNYYNSSTKPKFHKNTRLAGKIIEKTSLTFINQHITSIINHSIKSIYRNIISHTPFRKRNNKLISTWERKNNLTRKRNNLSIKSIYRNRISPTPFRKRNNKPISTWERINNLTRKRKKIKILIQQGKIK